MTQKHLLHSPNLMPCLYFLLSECNIWQPFFLTHGLFTSSLTPTNTASTSPTDSNFLHSDLFSISPPTALIQPSSFICFDSCRSFLIKFSTSNINSPLTHSTSRESGSYSSLLYNTYIVPHHFGGTSLLHLCIQMPAFYLQQ